MSLIADFSDRISRTDRQIVNLQTKMTTLKQDFSAFKAGYLDPDFEGAFKNIPEEILEEIFKYLPNRSLGVCARVNSQWYCMSREILVYHHYGKSLVRAIPRSLDIDTKYKILNLELRLEKCHLIALKKIKDVDKWLVLCGKIAVGSFVVMYMSAVINAPIPGGVDIDCNFYYGDF